MKKILNSLISAIAIASTLLINMTPTLAVTAGADLIYNGNGGTLQEGYEGTENVMYRHTIAEGYTFQESFHFWSAQFKREGYTLTGYNTKADGSGYTFALDVEVPYSEFIEHTDEENTDEFTVYAQWRKNPAPGEVTMTYDVAEEKGSAIFHLDTTIIAYDSANLSKDINYHITTTAGNYYLDNNDVKSIAYTVTAPNATLKDSHKETNTLTVTTDTTSSKGTLDLTTTVADENTYKGSIGTTSEKATKAGAYSGKTTVTFNCTI